MVLVNPPPTPVTTMGKVPMVAVCEAVMVRVVLQVGIQLVGEKTRVTPPGKPEADKLTDLDVPDNRLTVI